MVRHLGTQKALAAGLPLLAVVLIGVVGPTAGRYFIDLTSGVTPQQFTRGEWFVGTAVLTSVTYIILDGFGLATPSIWPATILAWLVGFGFRLCALRFKWEEPEPWDQERLHVSQGTRCTAMRSRCSPAKRRRRRPTKEYCVVIITFGLVFVVTASLGNGLSIKLQSVLRPMREHR